MFDIIEVKLFYQWTWTLNRPLFSCSLSHKMLRLLFPYPWHSWRARSVFLPSCLPSPPHLPPFLFFLFFSLPYLHSSFPPALPPSHSLFLLCECYWNMIYIVNCHFLDYSLEWINLFPTRYLFIIFFHLLLLNNLGFSFLSWAIYFCYYNINLLDIRCKCPKRNLQVKFRQPLVT